MAVRKVTYKLNLNKLGLDKVTAKQDAMRDVGEYLKEEILDHVSSIRSPIKGGAYKRTLSKKYKEYLRRQCYLLELNHFHHHHHRLNHHFLEYFLKHLSH